MLARDLFYCVKPLVPRRAQLALRRALVRYKRTRYAPVWPIDPASGRKPEGWTGWPEARQFALVLTHDVDTALGQENCESLAALEEELGFRSSFNFVPERYALRPELRRALAERGFEVGVHGLYHDGRLYSSEQVFLERAARINQYLKQWQAVGFRSPSMHHNLAWLHALDIEYDSSTFDTDPFEPQPDGLGVIFPLWVSGSGGKKGYVELPYTLPQDFTLFVLMEETTIDIWKKKLDWIAEKGGMVLLNAHPDYMSFASGPVSPQQYPATRYREFLRHVQERYQGAYWHVLPREMARFWASRFADGTER